jgi:DNA polymerase I-like protein with 3'-5' exonuclease and polymerase domains
MQIAIDTEGTGLFISKGCRPFTISSCDENSEQCLWKFRVDPFTRKVIYSESKLIDFLTTLERYDEIIFHNANYDIQAIEAAIEPILQKYWVEWFGAVPNELKPTRYGRTTVPSRTTYTKYWLFNNFTIHDTMVMSHAYKSSNKHGLKDLSILLLEYPDDDEEFLTKTTHEARRAAKKLNWTIADKNNLHSTLIGTQKEHFRCDYWVAEELALRYPNNHPEHYLTTCDTYALKDAERTMGLFIVLKEMMNRQQWMSYNTYARKLIPAILDMQAVGINILPDELASAKSTFQKKVASSVSKLRKLTKNPLFNPRSTKQLSKVFYDQYKFPPKKFGKGGAPSTDKSVISSLLAEAPLNQNSLPPKYHFLATLQEYRKEITTLQYIDNYDRHSRNPNRTLHPWFSQTKTGTGRLACENPNTTNVGKKNMANPFADEKDKVRAAQIAAILDLPDNSSFILRNVFGPAKGQKWTCIDYDQFQLRIFAHVSESYDLIEGFERGDDIHQLVASIIFNKSDISDVERTAAKAINFGILFGAGPAKIELLAGVPGLYGMFTDNFPKAKIYLDKQAHLATTRGYVHTVGGYRLYVPYTRSYAASCYVIQGTEAEIVRRAMSRINAEQHQSPFTLLMMVHDELVFTSPTSLTPSLEIKYLSKIMNTMEAASLSIPSKVDAKVALHNWADRTKFDFERIAT